jgi:hypothetical protein
MNAFLSMVLEAVQDSILDPELIFFIDEAWFHQCGYINA